MNKKQLISKIALTTKFTKKDSEKALNAIIESIQDTLKSNDNIALIGFGTFLVKQRSERKGINPRTKKEIIIPATKIPIFKSGKILKEIALNTKKTVDENINQSEEIIEKIKKPRSKKIKS